MKVLRIHITAWVASFRNPLFISGFQPTLHVPPLSTIYGLISAAQGDWATPDDVTVGFVFFSYGRSMDLETIYESGDLKKAKANICKREFLVEPELFLYTPNMWLKEFFEKPHYPLLLGRSTELATVESIKEVELEEVAEVTFQNTLLPMSNFLVPGRLHALPTHFTKTIPRRPQGIRPFVIVTEKIKYQGNALKDPEKGWGVYLHKYDDGASASKK